MKRLDTHTFSPISFCIVITSDHFMMVSLVYLITLGFLFSHGVIALLFQGTFFVTTFAKDILLVSTLVVIP